MTVFVVVFDPQGSSGGFEWFYVEDVAKKALERFTADDVPTLGIAKVDVTASTDPDEITREIDALLTGLERELGYVAPE